MLNPRLSLTLKESISIDLHLSTINDNSLSLLNKTAYTSSHFLPFLKVNRIIDLVVV